MRTRSQTRNRNRRQQQQTLPVVVEPCNLEEPIPGPTIVAMADRTMEELLRAPTEGYGEAIVLPEINADHFEIKTNLLQLVQANPFHGLENENPHAHINKFDESFSEAWERFKCMIRSCPHHGFSELTQVDTFYNGLNENEQDSLNAAAGGNLLSKTTREALNIIENKSKVRYSRNKTNASRVNSRENVSKTDERIDKLADQLSTLVEIVSKKVVVPLAPVKEVKEYCVTCGGAHAWRLGHVNFKNLNKLVKGNLVRGLPSKIFQNDHTCVACQKGKQHKASCKAKSVSSISHSLQLLHMDLFGPTSVRSLNHKTYCLVITDDFSRFSWVFFLRTKDETSGILKDFVRQIENQLNQKVKTIRCDNGTEFKNKDVIEFCGSKGIKREYSNARTPQQNRVAERKNRTLIEAARTMLADSFLPNTFWAEAL
ncbi:putative ribonuclease H-like domain-containing protein [Tanacetum coccineum]